MRQSIAVLGGGNGGHAVAAEMALAGHEVRMYEDPKFIKNINKVYKTKEIKIVGVGTVGLAKLSMVTSNIEAAIKGVKYIIIPLPAFCHQIYAELLADHVEDGQIILLLPGTFGSLVFNKIFKEKGVRKKITFAEANSLPYNARLLEPGKIHVYGLNTPLELGIFPAKETANTIDKLEKLYEFNEIEDVMACGLISLNPVAHTPGCLLNAGRIERSKGEFWLYEEGVTPCVARVMEELDKERIALMGRFGYKAISMEEALAGDREPRTMWEEINGSTSLTPIKGPVSIKNRYFTEDIPYGLVPWAYIGDLVGIDTPVMDSIINLGNIIIKQDSWQTGRKLDDLGITNMTVEQVKSYMYNG